jgi:hypothetical protein
MRTVHSRNGEVRRVEGLRGLEALGLSIIMTCGPGGST